MYVQFLDYFRYALMEGDHAPVGSTSCPDTCGMQDANSMCCAKVRFYHPRSDTESFTFQCISAIVADARFSVEINDFTVQLACDSDNDWTRSGARTLAVGLSAIGLIGAIIV